MRGRVARRTAMSDTAAAQRVRQGDRDAFLLLVDRHSFAVHAYLRTCLTDRGEVDSLTEETFRRGYQVAVRGVEPHTHWRLQLLATARGLALSAWARDPYSVAIADGFRYWAATGGVWPLTARSFLFEAFRSLPTRWQTVLWHTAVEQDSAALTSDVLGLESGHYTTVTQRARQALREFYLDLYRRTVVHQPSCVAFVQSYGRRPALSFEEWALSHPARCVPCSEVEFDLSDIGYQLRAQLPAALLGWWHDVLYREARATPLPMTDPSAFLPR
ncbi:RNA polymerase sigma factor [Streptomyces sp. NPDC127074]|uniref:RNA polymerase sigma factor n=1 Tax=Streptomyces sp. NPDC127074 TaxID=3347130 RepID=UPI003667278F